MAGRRSFEHHLRAVAVRARQGNLGTAARNRIRSKRGRPRRLLPHPSANRSRAASRRVNRLLPDLGAAPRYLEIGVDRGITFDTIEATHRTGVEPTPRFDLTRIPAGAELFVGTSDEFFVHFGDRPPFHLVFADGLHQYRQTYRDVINAFQRLERRGLVLVDDVVPSDEVSALPDPDESLRQRAERELPGTGWHGDVFLMLSVLRDHHPNLEFRTIVGSGNEQALVWNAEPDEPPSSVDAGTLERYASITYDDVFAAGIPAWFNPVVEDDAISEAVAAVHRR
jgi:hypothetical protein